MIKAIIFDIGGVLINKSPVLDEILKEFNLEKEEMYDYYLEMLRKHEIGEINEAKFWELLKGKFNITISIPHPSPLIRRYKQEIRINLEVLKILQELRKSAYKVAALSNIIPAHVQHLSNLGLLNNFDVKVLSCEAGLLKPNEKIYRLTLKKLGVESSEAIFIDDDQSYVRGAEKVGIKSINFNNPKQLKRVVKEFLNGNLN